MGSTDPRGEGDRVRSSAGYEAMLEEYRRKMAEMERESEGDPRGRAALDLMLRAAPLLVKYLPIPACPTKCARWCKN